MEKLPPGTQVTVIDYPGQVGTVQDISYMNGIRKNEWNYYIRWDHGGLGVVAHSRLIVVNKIEAPPYITGLHGCRCHPFRSWEECDKAHKQRFKPGQKVRDRHTGEKATVIGMEDNDPHWWRILQDPGIHASDIRIAHSANLILETEPHQLSMFQVNNVI